MRVSAYLKNKQPIVYRTFSNALSKGTVTHSYLLMGEEGTPLKETALYLAKSLLCDHPEPLADETCVTCERVDKEEYPDLLLLDGSEKNIKKEEILSLVNDFQKTPMERKGVMIYIVNMVENMSVEAVNSLLKFLEEPTPNTYAFLTTRNESKVLPTIISRCQTLRLHLVPRYEVIEEALSLGVSQNDAEMLAFFYNDGSLIKERSETKAYQNAKAAFDHAIEGLDEGPSFARYTFEKDVTSALGDKPSARFFFDMLSVFFQDLVAKKVGDAVNLTSYDKILGELSQSLPHLEESLIAIMTLRGDIELNVNMSLLLGHLVNTITKE
jgi:DNA polymerase-3 subunit delta'